MSKAIDLKGLVLPQLVEVHRREDNPNIAEFRIQPLERGYGHTLGNAMRRMLLSSLRGSAVWGFRIDGVVHEHQTVPGAVEDVHLIIGNLKNLVLAMGEEADEVVLRIARSSAGPVTAAHIEPNANVRVVDTRHHLFTLQDDRDVNVELYVNKGRGYVEADGHVADRGLPVDLVKIDREVASLAETNRDWSAVVQAMTSLAHALRKGVVVVGIESAGQMEQVERVGCDYAQGHFFARPLPVSAATKLIHSPPKWRLSA